MRRPTLCLFADSGSGGVNERQGTPGALGNVRFGTELFRFALGERALLALLETEPPPRHGSSAEWLLFLSDLPP
jgi:hypothetical protein